MAKMIVADSMDWEMEEARSLALPSCMVNILAPRFVVCHNIKNNMNANKKTNLCKCGYGGGRWRAVCVIIALLAFAVTASAKVEYGERQFDGEHKHEASAYMMAGNNVVSDAFVGIAASYVHHFTPRWHLGGDAQIQALKRLYSIDVTGGYRLPIRFGNIYFEGKGLINRYNRWGFTEAIFNVSATWESAYVDIRLGESLIHYWSHKSETSYGYTEPLTLTFGSATTTISTSRTGTSTGASAGMRESTRRCVCSVSSTSARQAR